MKRGDWLCPKCDFLNFAKNIKCLRCDGLFQERLRQLHEDQDHLPLKKGDWICDKCNFLNFAKNTRCLQCKEKPPKRQLNMGEWEYASAQPPHDTGGYHNKSGMSFVKVKTEINDQLSVGQNRHQDRGSNMWRFVEDNSGVYDGSSSWNEDSGFVNFPIAGGKSDLSQNAQRREKWKSEMLERSKSTVRTRPELDEVRSYGFPRMLDFPSPSRAPYALFASKIMFL
ncbi:zinc finger protein var3 [Quercus suber]|uniref:Zinc finger protein var3 n=1 Tax=Quercus suber TaxID=58331 RepID=A0AAW0LDM0_QUESU